MASYVGLLVACVFLTIYSVSGLEINVLESFNLQDGVNGIQTEESGSYFPVYSFGRTPKGIVASDDVAMEFYDLLSKSKEFIITLNVKPGKLNRGSVLWLQSGKIGPTLFAIWIRSGRKGKITIPYRGEKGTQYTTFDNIDQLSDDAWHNIVLHIFKEDRGYRVNVYADCMKVGSKKADIHFDKANSPNLEFRLGQRALAGNIFGRWRGALSDFYLVVKRDISKFIQSDRCQRNPGRKFLSPPYQPVGAIADYPRILAAADPPQDIKLPANMFASLLKKVEEGSNDQNNLRKILKIVEDLQQTQSNQVYELKSLRQILELLTTWQGSTNSLAISTRRVNGSDQTDACAKKPCFPFVKCINVPSSEGFQCGPCPPGLSGNGVSCTDIDECKHDPCSKLTKCENRVPGYTCSSCPQGYRGDSIVGLGLRQATNKKQVCEDIDECKEGTHNCDPNANCINTEGGFTCGACKTGFVKDNHGTCKRAQICMGPSGSSVNPCSIYAKCIPLADGVSHKCQCAASFSGDGYVCGKDSDMDGFPDQDLPCKTKGCKKDNCPKLPNSGQEDVDKDGIGDACDDDIDNDGWFNALDNCPFVSNMDQTNTDTDDVGDACDNCLLVFNPDQIDSDRDKMGDLCDSDLDGDGVLNIVDNCAMINNPNQKDSDRDGIGDACDNCPDVPNTSQSDLDNDGYGDVCDSNDDSDHDGVIDRYDNCASMPNSAQLDTDMDGIGDVCDKDDDNDNVVDDADNCRLIPNVFQEDKNRDGLGDVCQTDYDGDKYGDEDTCPYDKNIFVTDFRLNELMIIGYFDRNAQHFPKWTIRDQGREVIQEKNSAPSVLLTKHSYEGILFTGTLYVNTESDDDFIGLVFSYQNSRSFYLVSWKQREQRYWKKSRAFAPLAKTGVEIKLVKSDTGTPTSLREAIWHTGNYTGQTQLLWRDASNQGWKDFTPYQWKLIHRPKTGLMRLEIYEKSSLLVDSGYFINTELRGGKVGLFAFSQEGVIWSNIEVKCDDGIPDDTLSALRAKLSL